MPERRDQANRGCRGVDGIVSETIRRQHVPSFYDERPVRAVAILIQNFKLSPRQCRQNKQAI